MRIGKVVHVEHQQNQTVIEIQFSDRIPLEYRHWFEVMHDQNLAVLHEAKDRKVPVFVWLNEAGTHVETVELYEYVFGRE